LHCKGKQWTPTISESSPKPPKTKKRSLEEEIEAHKLSFETVQNLDPSIRLIYEKDEFFPEEEACTPIMCPYRGVPREIDPAVCEYHNELEDPECFSCKMYKGRK